MTFLHWISKGVKKSRYQLAQPNEEPKKGCNDSVHGTPPGEWPSTGPRPSKVAVVLFYLSVIATVIGTLISIRTVFYVKDSDQMTVFVIGCGLIGVGIFLIIITNCINNREHSRIMSYLNFKVEELQMDENSRAKRNLRNSSFLLEEQTGQTTA